MIQDEEGRCWIIGYETSQWYYHDGQKWEKGLQNVYRGQDMIKLLAEARRARGKESEGKTATETKEKAK